MSSTTYDRQTSFALFSAENPTLQQSGASLDAEFNAVKLSMDDTQQNLAKIQDDDGAVKRGSIGKEQFDSSVSIGFAAPAQWATGVLYTAFVSTVFHSSIFYIANVTHTSGAVFDASKWNVLADFTTSAVIPDGSIASVKLADGAVAANKLADGVVTNSKLATNAVTTNKVANNAILLAKLGSDVPAQLRDLIIPAGAIWPYAGASVPSGWLLCAGQNVSRTAYPNLFAALGGGAIYGFGDGSTTFTMPDLRGRVPAGLDSMTGTPAGRLTTTLTGIGLGDFGGEEWHTLTTSEIPSHTHANTLSDPGHTHPYVAVNNSEQKPASGGTAAYTSTTTVNTTSNTTGITITNVSTGGGGAHNNVQPTLVINYIIKAH
ncbi:phage tail protein [Bradyrhizobium sp.]|jgi:microcystin-dependent protein|uniref:phage tail protein n=1 Tax=Bradyrhizobium sp. TaxID=376 RepID=UPI002DDCA9DA|nr:tail fiber protein [Bradyrhizobium sp.]HEV2153178.1 tail fiber protein [Bradyrhizobium sp.]